MTSLPMKPKRPPSSPPLSIPYLTSKTTHRTTPHHTLSFSNSHQWKTQVPYPIPPPQNQCHNSLQLTNFPPQPVAAEISSIIHTLTQGSPSAQRAALEKYFAPTASFTHPFCRTGSFNGSRWLIWCIYRWYKILSPRIELGIDSVGKWGFPFCGNREAGILWNGFLRQYLLTIGFFLPKFCIAYDSRNLILYVSIHQFFQVWALPFLSAHASLVTVLQLVPSSASAGGRPSKYVIKSQTDMYQVTEISKFISPFKILPTLLVALQLVSTGACVLGTVAGWPITWVEENVLGGNKERSLGDAITG